MEIGKFYVWVSGGRAGDSEPGSSEVIGTLLMPDLFEAAWHCLQSHLRTYLGTQDAWAVHFDACCVSVQVWAHLHPFASILQWISGTPRQWIHGSRWNSWEPRVQSFLHWVVYYFLLQHVGFRFLSFFKCIIYIYVYCMYMYIYILGIHSIDTFFYNFLPSKPQSTSWSRVCLQGPALACGILSPRRKCLKAEGKNNN